MANTTLAKSRAVVPVVGTGEQWSSATYRANFEKMDALFGAFECTSTTRPGTSVRYNGMLIHETDTGKILIWTGSVWRIVACSSRTTGRRFRNGAGLTFANGWTTPALDSTSYAGDLCDTFTSGGFTVEVAGRYKIRGQVMATAVSSGQEIASRITINGAEQIRGASEFAHAAGSWNFVCPVQGTLTLDVGDQVVLQAFNSSATAAAALEGTARIFLEWEMVPD